MGIDVVLMVQYLYIKLYCTEICELFFKDNDITGISSLLISLILMPLIISVWDNRTKSKIPNFTISIRKSELDDKVLLYFDLTNDTNSRIFITNFRIKTNDKNLKISTNASKDISTGYSELKFPNNNSSLTELYYVLDSGQKTLSNIEISDPLDKSILTYKRSFQSIVLRSPKYYTLKYTAMVGDKRYLIKTIV